MTPKILHLYWGKNRPLSFFRYLTIHSFYKLNPDWVIKLWTPMYTSKAQEWTTGEQVSSYNGKDYLQELYPFIHLVDFDRLKLSNDLPEVHKSDLLRWFLLACYGGVWADMDILFTKPMPDLDNWHGAGLCKYRAIPDKPYDFLSIGFNVSSDLSGRMFFQGLFNLGVTKYIQRPKGYQAFGAELLGEFIEKHGKDHLLHYFSPQLVYPYFYHNKIKLFWSPGDLPTEGVIGYHWYAGMPLSGQIESTITPDNLSSLSRKHSICKEALKIWR